MSTDRTEIEWPYRPPDFFEVPYRRRSTEYELVADGGRVLVTLAKPQDPVPEQMRNQIQRDVDNLFRLRQLQIHRRYEVENPRISQHHPEGRRSVAISVGGTMAAGAMAGQTDAIVRDSLGNLVRDTKAERIVDHTRFLDDILPKVAHSPILESMLASYHAATEDPKSELVHLYEIRDTLAKHYGNEQAARQSLGISRREWQRLGVLANVKPLREGRHRGEHPLSRRPASAAELEEARGIARRWIAAFSAKQ